MQYQKALLGIGLALTLSACTSINHLNDPLVLQDQGSFAIGGTYITHGGTFSNENFLSPEGQRA